MNYFEIADDFESLAIEIEQIKYLSDILFDNHFSTRHNSDRGAKESITKYEALMSCLLCSVNSIYKKATAYNQKYFAMNEAKKRPQAAECLKPDIYSH